MAHIEIDWSLLRNSYPLRELSGPLKEFMRHTPGTPCCVQLSHAFAGCGISIGSHSHRRQNSIIDTEFGRNFYMLAVDEVIQWLTDNFGDGENVGVDEDGRRRSTREIKQSIDGRTGILAFSNNAYGTHVELWDTNRMHQPDMSEALFTEKKVLFWDVGLTP